MKQDPESDSELEITDLSDCSSENENEPDFPLGKEPGLGGRSHLLGAKSGGLGGVLPPLSSLPPPVSPHPLKSLGPLTPPPSSLPPSRSPSLTMVDRHRETETPKLAHS